MKSSHEGTGSPFGAATKLTKEEEEEKKTENK